MYFLIFAGGSGQRLWPLSRKNSPKQFSQLKGERSTLQMAVDRIESFGLDHICISTNQAYKDLVMEQLPGIAEKNIMLEPARRDLAAAVGLSLHRMKHAGMSGAVAVLWSDHFVDNPSVFQEALRDGQKLVEANPEKIIFFGEEPRFANHNLGWIHVGEQTPDREYAFLEWQYRPEVERCNQMFASGEWLWNPGYFIFDIDTMLSWYAEYQPKMNAQLEKMVTDDTLLQEAYSTLPAMSFDDAIVKHIEPERGVVIKTNMGWSDPGTLYALKEAMEPSLEKNYEKGQVVAYDSTDCFVYNEEKEKLVATIGLEGMMVVNTGDALLVCPKDRVPDIKALLKEIQQRGLDSYL